MRGRCGEMRAPEDTVYKGVVLEGERRDTVLEVLLVDRPRRAAQLAEGLEAIEQPVQLGARHIRLAQQLGHHRAIEFGCELGPAHRRRWARLDDPALRRSARVRGVQPAARAPEAWRRWLAWDEHRRRRVRCRPDLSWVRGRRGPSSRGATSLYVGYGGALRQLMAKGPESMLPRVLTCVAELALPRPRAAALERATRQVLAHRECQLSASIRCKGRREGRGRARRQGAHHARVAGWRGRRPLCLQRCEPPLPWATDSRWGSREAACTQTSAHHRLRWAADTRREAGRTGAATNGWRTEARPETARARAATGKLEHWVRRRVDAVDALGLPLGNPLWRHGTPENFGLGAIFVAVHALPLIVPMPWHPPTSGGHVRTATATAA